MDSTQYYNRYKKRDKLHKLTKQQPFNMLLKNKYKQYKNKLTEIISKAKYLYSQNSL